MSIAFELESSEVMSSVEKVQSRSILERVADGEDAAVEACVDTYGGILWSIARRYVKTHTDAEDAVQDIFIELWKQAEKFDPGRSSETTFVTMIARRRLIDRLRKRQPVGDGGGVSVEDVEIPQLASTPLLETSEEAEKALLCIEKLSAQQQNVINLSIHHGASHRCIAEQLAMPLGTVKSYARRALIQLRDCMQKRSNPAPLTEGMQ